MSRFIVFLSCLFFTTCHLQVFAADDDTIAKTVDLPANGNFTEIASTGKTILASEKDNVGIGTANPSSSVKLEVAGAIKIGTDSSACDSNNAGAIRYNSEIKLLELCNGSSWESLTTSRAVPVNYWYSPGLYRGDFGGDSFCAAKGYTRTVGTAGDITNCISAGVCEDKPSWVSDATFPKHCQGVNGLNWTSSSSNQEGSYYDSHTPYGNPARNSCDDANHIVCMK